MNLPKIAGIYKITNTLNGLYYIGSSINIKKRYSGHFTKLRANKHANFHLQAAFNKYGEVAFCFEVLEDCSGQSLEELRDTEQKYIDAILNWSDCYNIQKQTVTIFLPPIGESTRQKMSVNTKGERNPNFGKKHSEKVRLEMAEMKRVRGAGVKFSESSVWVVEIKLLNQKKSIYLGTYEDESTARKVRYLSEKLYWDNDDSVKEELNSLQLLAKNLTITARKRGMGVTITPDNTWKVNITVNEERIYLGIYKTEQLARTVRDLAEKVYWDNDKSFLPELETAKLQANTAHNQKHYGGGVVFDKRRGDWLARIRLNGKTVQVGTFKTEDEAKERRVQADKYYYDGDESFAYLFDKPKKEKTLPTGVQLRDNGKYRAVINIKNKRYTLGTFIELEDAIAARLAAEQSLLS